MQNGERSQRRGAKDAAILAFGRVIAPFTSFSKIFLAIESSTA
jgi:hypothetical protein